MWTYDLASNTWRNRRPLPAPHVAPLRCASWDSDEQVVIDTNIDLTNPQSLTGEPVYERKFNREQFDESGRPYRFGVFVYRIRAVNTAGVESGPSPPFFAIPTAPQWLFSNVCHPAAVYCPSDAPADRLRCRG